MPIIALFLNKETWDTIKKIEYKIKTFVTKTEKKSLSKVLEEKKTLKEVL